MPAETIDTSSMIIRDAGETDTVLAFDEEGNMFKARLPAAGSAPDVPVDALVINDQPSLTVVAGQDLLVTLGPKQNNGKTVSYSVAGSGAASLTMIDSNTGTFNSSTVAAQAINVTGDDGSGGTDTAVITIDVTAVVVNPPANTAPVINDQNLEAVEGQNLPIDLGGSDADGDSLTYTLTGAGAANYTESTNSTGIFNSAVVGTEVINVTVSDGTATDTAIITINVAAVVVNPPANTAPVINDQNLEAVEGQNLVIDLGGSDADGDSLAYTLTGAGAANYTESTNSTGIFNSAVAGTEVINVTVSDGTAADTAVITIVVSAPVAGTYSVASGSNIRAGLPVKKTAHVYLASGQSNGQGRGARVDAPAGSDPGPIAGVKTWRRNQDGNMFSGTGAWYPLDYEYNQYEGRNEFGSILKFGLNLSANVHSPDDDVYFISANSNGVPIQNWLDGGPEQVGLYAHINAALLSLVNDPDIDEVVVHDFFMDQGESDSDTEILANAHKAKLKRVIKELRENLGLPNLSVTLRQLDSTLNYAFVSTVIAGQNALADEDINIHIVKGPYTYNQDGIHLDGTAQNLVGDQRFTASQTNKGQIYNG